MTKEIPEEIRALRQRLAQLDVMAESNAGFNQAIRRIAGKAEPPEPSPWRSSSCRPERRSDTCESHEFPLASE